MAKTKKFQFLYFNLTSIQIKTMKSTKNYYNSLKYYLLNKKTYKLFLIKSNFQLIKLKNIELQLKKTIKLFFKIMYKNIFLLNFNINFKLLTQLKQKTVFYINKFSNLNLFIYFMKERQLNINMFNQLLNSEFTQLFCFFSSMYKKKQKIFKIFGNLTNIIISNILQYLKKTKNFYYYNYLLIWNYKNCSFIFQLFYFLILKIQKLSIKKYKR